MLVFDDFLPKCLTTVLNAALQLSDPKLRLFDTFSHFCNFFIRLGILGTLLGDPGPPEANVTVRSFQTFNNFYYISITFGKFWTPPGPGARMRTRTPRTHPYAGPGARGPGARALEPSYASVRPVRGRRETVADRAVGPYCHSPSIIKPPPSHLADRRGVGWWGFIIVSRH